ncbi:TPA: DNA-directed RNA polymerase subunit H [archaeon]|uniref:DNA-directed RNA polymerase subunit Rpo5 n=1 Tax=Candidatus Naiadarchaeum limnaeum TaxID=2756139 RepID=A0A832USL2_9ARCH|nr:DNA-directed RNA polymerase subunit H [Candidatus Naiadarchaeum limnaeum]
MAEKKEEILLIEHEFIPKHELITEEEVAKLLEEYPIRKDQLPKIFRNDPAIRHLSAKRGDVIRIIRKSPTAGRAVYYRIVV